jgi:N-acetylglucosaminyldiphosphoundecaprenol N-acetyl-beta-D-mannosaminyltransferase
MSDIDNISIISLPKYQVAGNTVNLFGIDVHALTMHQALDNINEAIQGKKSLHIGMLNAAKIVNMKRDPNLGEDVNSSDMIMADGSSVVAASKLLNKPLPERIAGIDLMHAILERGDQLGYRVYCLGATEDISKKVEKEILDHYPGVIIAGRKNGYFSSADEEGIAQQIADSHADVIFVAITSPKKEQFMAKWNNVMRVPVVHGVGGSFDVLAGKVQRAPLMWQRCGMEWLYRVIQEPGRLWMRYLMTNTLFITMMIREIFKSSSR